MWTDTLHLAPESRTALAALPAREVPRGAVLFRPGDHAQGFVVVLSGRIEVRLTSASGREILLYAVEPGESCVQTTLGLMGDEPYSGEATAATEARVVVIPRPLFLRLLDDDDGFRRFVMNAFGQRMAELTHLLEQVAFGRVEVRLAEALIELASGGVVEATQAELAARIGTAREVVSRRLEAFERSGWVAVERGHVRLHDLEELRRLADQAV
jgi:CRP/FNR family transcriptional regulator, anaerobic regulatory protein